jgi:hypothetical protein
MKENSIKGIISAPSTNKDSIGIVFFNCTIKRESDSIPKSCYALGRPWHPSGDSAKLYGVSGMAIYKDCWMDDMIKSVGWDSMSSTLKGTTSKTVMFYPYNLTDARFYEFNSTGPGSISTANPPWRKFLTSGGAANYTIEKVLGGWNPDLPVGLIKVNPNKILKGKQLDIIRCQKYISFKIRTTQNISSVVIFTADGKEVLSLPAAITANGEYTAQVSGSLLSKGVYFIKAVSSENVFATKFILAD